MSVLYHKSPTTGLAGAVALVVLRIPGADSVPVIVMLPALTVPVVKYAATLALLNVPVIRSARARPLAKEKLSDRKLVDITFPALTFPVIPTPPTTVSAPVSVSMLAVPLATR